MVDPALRTVHGTANVIVSGARSTERAVVKVGGTITHELPMIGGYSAKIPANDINTDRAGARRTRHHLEPPDARAVQHPRATNNIPSVYKKATGGDKLSGPAATASASTSR